MAQAVRVRVSPKAPNSSFLQYVEVQRTRLSAGFLLGFYPARGNSTGVTHDDQRELPLPGVISTDKELDAVGAIDRAEVGGRQVRGKPQRIQRWLARSPARACPLASKAR